MFAKIFSEKTLTRKVQVVADFLHRHGGGRQAAFGLRYHVVRNDFAGIAAARFKNDVREVFGRQTHLVGVEFHFALFAVMFLHQQHKPVQQLFLPRRRFHRFAAVALYKFRRHVVEQDMPVFLQNQIFVEAVAFERLFHQCENRREKFHRFGANPETAALLYTVAQREQQQRVVDAEYIVRLLAARAVQYREKLNVFRGFHHLEIVAL